MVTRERFAELAYPVEIWRVDADASVEVSIEDGAHANKVLATKTLKKTFQQEDRVVRAQPQYNVAGDGNDLPGAGDLETELISDLPRQVTAFVAETLAGYPAQLQADVAGAEGPQQCEMLGRALLFADVSGAKLPEHAHWEELVRHGCGGPGANAVAPARVAPPAVPAHRAKSARSPPPIVRASAPARHRS